MQIYILMYGLVPILNIILVILTLKGNIEHNEEAGICTLKFTKLWILYIGTFSANVVVIIISYVHIYITVARFELIVIIL